MEERVREMQWDYRGRRSSMMRYHLETKHYPTSAPVPLEPWDRQAILDYRNRVNANSNARLRSDEHYPRMRDGAPAEDADRSRWPRLRDVSSSPPRIRRNQDWRFREQEPPFYHHQVCAPPNPNHALDQGRLFRLSGEKRARLELNNDEEFQMRRRPKFLQHEHLRFPLSPPPPPPPPPLPPSLPLPPPFPLPLPHRDVYLPSPRVKWQHDLFEHTPNVTNKQMRDRDAVSFGSSIVGGRGFDGFIAVEDDLSKGVEVDEEEDDEDSRRNLTSLLSDLKDQVLASTPGARGPEISETGKGKPHIRGRNQNVNESVGTTHSKKLKNKNPPSTQASQKKVKTRKNPIQSSSASAFVQQGKMSQNGSFSHLLEATPQGEESSETKYERSTADLSVVFRRSGMVAQEVVSTIDNNWHDFALTKSFASKVSIPQEDLEEEEGEIKSAESYDALYEGKRLTDHQNRDSQLKIKSMNLPSETISSEKDLIVQGDSTQPPCYLEGIDIGTTSAVQSEERFVPECNYFVLGGRGSDSPATLISNPADGGQPTAESISTCMADLKQQNNLAINASSRPNLTPRVMQEGSYQDTSLTSLACDAIDNLDYKERLQKKLKFEQREMPPLNDNVRPEEPLLTSSVLQAHTDVMESQGTVTADQVLTNMTLRSNLSHQSSGVYQFQSSQLEKKFSQSTISSPILPQSKLSISSQPTKTKVVASSVLAGRSRSWHRTNNVTSSSSLVKPQVIQNDTSVVQKVAKREKFHSAAYVRKGNSLVRAPCPPMGLSCTKSSFAGSLTTDKTKTLNSSSLKVISATGDIDNVLTGLGSNIGSSGLSSTTAYRIPTPAFESPTTPPVVAASKSPVCISASPESLVPASMCGTPTEVHTLTTGAQVEDCKINGKSDVSVTNNLFESLMGDTSLLKRNQNEGHIENALAGQMMHSKWKSNRLIADSMYKKQGSVASIGEGVHLPPNCLVQDRYYKRKKNQLVRSNLPMDRKITKPLEVPNISSLETELNVQTLKDQRRRTFIQTKLGRVLKQKNHWTSQSSWVWTLDEAETSNIPLLQSRRVTPLLCPWKRPSYGKSGLVGKLKAVPSISKGSPLSLIRKKLKRLQKRDTVYTKSPNGFSLHRSGVLSLGGSNLKWTKSIEKRSKEASEEITMAVAATEKKKREAKAVGDVIPSVSKDNAVRRSFKPSQGIKSRARKSKQATVEHIVQVGLFRYKMDPSKRTLQMIPAEEPPSNFNTSLARQTIDTSKRFTLKGVAIGDDAYLRVGNGNKLVRDPKKVCRVLASEKVRWSLHTARRRLAKKQQYCQFFTRFGKCNKEDGKCPYIHDREKIAVCTKFLKGNCSNGSCELTHKIIPERMEDCSFFLQGFCTNENCPYRHVNVNPKAPVCDGFLKGYCAEGDKCNKKHTHVCPQYATTGECLERLSCKLHHPKKKDKPKGSTRRKSGTIAKRRYFVADDLGVSELASKLLRLVSEQQIAFESPPRMPECVEFISLDVSEEGVDDIDSANGAMSSVKRSQTDLFSSDGLPVDDIDMMIKPVRLLRKEQTVHTCRVEGIEKQTNELHMN